MGCGCGGSQQVGQRSGSTQAANGPESLRGVAHPDTFWNGPQRKTVEPAPAPSPPAAPLES